MVTAEVEQRRWGRLPSVCLSTSAVAVEVVADLGARVVSLRDVGRDREWLVQGQPPEDQELATWAEEEAIFGGAQSFGWDECLPTTAPCVDPLLPDGPGLRDHGDHWARAADVSLDVEESAVVHTWSSARWPYRLSRRIGFEDAHTLHVRYHVVSHARQRLPIHWAMHPVLQLEPGSYLDLPDVHDSQRSWQTGIRLPDRMAWPRTTTLDGRDVDLACVRGLEDWAAVLYAVPAESVRAVAPDGARLDFDWDRDFAPALRIWLSYGGWPPGGPPSRQVALEPCTSMHDDLAGAMADDEQRWLEPGAELRWWVRLRLSG